MNVTESIPTMPASMEAPPSWKAPTPLPLRFETRRLVLRLYQASDAESLFRAVNSSRESLLPWIVWAKMGHRQLHETVYFIENRRRASQEPGATSFAIGIFDRVSGDVVGGTSFHGIHPASHESEIGYWIRGDRRGQGLCTESTRGMISWGFTPQSRGGWGLRRIHIKCAEQNLGSRAIPQKIGLTQELRARQERYVPDIGWVDTLGWGVLVGDWDVGGMKLR
ncbi:MAG: GNAT family N-acetyltransferase [Pyrinomonadaceae bacterium]|nr:GNAT family N-acetyltransferase [Phycisphaerales bacterium]